MDTKKLRQKILDLAIRGKLVPQDPNDEPASVLLERIRAEKERLIKEGKIKRSKKFTSDTPHYENEVPFEVPDSWEWCSLEVIVSPDCTLGYGIVQPMEDIPNGIPVVRPVDLTSSIIGLDGLKRIDRKISDNYQRTILKGGEILFCVRASVGKVGIASAQLSGANVTRGISPLRFNYECLTKYVFYHLQSLFSQSEIKKYSKGATLQQINVEDLKILSIALPPLAEQCRIVVEIERWLSYIDILENCKDDLNKSIQQTKSRILDLAIHGKLVPQDPNDEPAIELLKRINPKFTPCDNAHYGNVPVGWQSIELGKVCQLTEGEPKEDAELPYLDVKAMRTGQIVRKSSGKYVEAGTVLILVDGENSGEVFKTEAAGYQGSTMKVLNIDINMNEEYVLQFIRLFKTTLKENKVGSAIPHLNKKMFRGLVIPIPPLNEQTRIVAAIQQYESILDGISANL